MLGEEGKAVRPGQALQLIGQLLAQIEHPQPHGFQLCRPIGTQGLIVQDHGYQPRAVIGREGVILPVQERQRVAGDAGAALIL